MEMVNGNKEDYDDDIDNLWGDIKDDELSVTDLDVIDGGYPINDLISPLEKYRAGYLRVSDVTSQAWCEQKMFYSTCLPPNIPVVEAPQIAIGSALHLARELAIQDIVEVDVTHKEERFAIRVLNLLGSVKDLLSGIPMRREIPVFGVPFESGIFFMGVIDELRCDSVTLDLDLMEFKTRVNKTVPNQAQRKTHHLQLMMYKCLLEDMIKNKLTKEEIALYLHLDLNKQFGEKIMKCLEMNTSLNCLDKLLDELFSVMQAMPYVNQLLIEYCCQQDGQTFQIEAVQYNEDWLKLEVTKSLEFWTGSREIQGVDVEEAWKCRTCEFSEVCEWRLQKIRQHNDHKCQ